jgi:hypothetical protein
MRDATPMSRDRSRRHTVHRVGRWLLALASAASVSLGTRAALARVDVLVSADLRQVPRLERRIADELRQRGSDETVNAYVGRIAASTLAEFLPIFTFVTATPREASVPTLVAHLKNMGSQQWPAGELGMSLELVGGPQTPAWRILDVDVSERDITADEQWLRGPLANVITTWNASIEAVFRQIPVERPARVQGRWVLLETTYEELGIRPDQAVFALEAADDARFLLFRPCHHHDVWGPFVSSEAQDCQQTALTNAIPSGATEISRWVRTYLVRYWSDR